VRVARVGAEHQFDQPLPRVFPAWVLAGLEDPFDARVFPALDKVDLDGFAIRIPPFPIGPLNRGVLRT